MKKSYIYALVVLVVLAAGVTWAVASKKKTNTPSTTNDTSMHMGNSSSSESNASNTRTDTDSVTIENFAFTPANIAVKVGATVTWTNKDSVAHTVVETDGQDGPNSKDLVNGASYTFTFTKAGTYHYHCSVHPSMTGTVTVTE